MPYADFMARYSIVAPKIFSDMASDPKGCANKALPTVGMDPDDFRTGHTKVRTAVDNEIRDLFGFDERVFVREGKRFKVNKKMSITTVNTGKLIRFVLSFHTFNLCFLPPFLSSFLPSFLISFLHSSLPSFLPAFLPSFRPSFLLIFLLTFCLSFLLSFLPSL